MNNSKTPDWLLEVQNKSWEPEILISGITLTFVFVLSNYIYNFYGMLVQDYGVFDGIAKTSYRISVIAVTGLKIILILHLILRGLWTGIVGMSYVFPGGVNQEKLPKSQRNIMYDKPDTLVIKLEKICSLLFSFIFSSIWIGIALFLYFIPLVILFLAGLDQYIIKIISLAYSLVTFVLVIVIALFFKTKFENSKLKQKLENSIFNNILATYLTNIGRAKTILIFLVYFLVIFFISRSAIVKYDFYNHEGMESTSTTDIIRINNNLYEDSRDHKLRIPKATINQFRITSNSIKLFISHYKKDSYTIKELQKNTKLCKNFRIEADSTKKVNLFDLYNIMIDDKLISGLKWYVTENIYTQQEGITTTIPVDTINSGYHELKINKLYLRTLNKKIKRIENWIIIPFEIVSKN